MEKVIIVHTSFEEKNAITRNAISTRGCVYHMRLTVGQCFRPFITYIQTYRPTILPSYKTAIIPKRRALSFVSILITFDNRTLPHNVFVMPAVTIRNDNRPQISLDTTILIDNNHNPA